MNFETKLGFHIAVGSPAADAFELDASSAALIASLGALIKVKRNPAGATAPGCLLTDCHSLFLLRW